MSLSSVIDGILFNIKTKLRALVYYNELVE